LVDRQAIDIRRMKNLRLRVAAAKLLRLELSTRPRSNSICENGEKTPINRLWRLTARSPLAPIKDAYLWFR
jgi:hypothetical protein